MDALGIAALEVGILVTWIGPDLGVGHAQDAVGQCLNLIAHLRRHIHRALSGQKVVVRIVGRIQQVLNVQLTEDHCEEHIIPRHRVVGMLLRDVAKDPQRAVEVDVVEVGEALPDLGVQVERRSVQVRLGYSRIRQEDGEQCDKT